MNRCVVLAYAGGIHASAAITWLIDMHGVEVVAVILDVGQGQDLGELHARALAGGVSRAHVIDARDEFARDVLLPSLHAGSEGEGSYPAIATLPRSIVARKLVEIARIEGARTVAHGSNEAAWDDEIRAIDSTLRVIAPAREWTMSDADLVAYARARGASVQPPSAPGCRVVQNLWGRMLSWEGDEAEPSIAHSTTARPATEKSIVDIHFESGVPTAINDVPMSPAELIECLSLIAGQHGIGRVVAPVRGSRHVICDAPAAVVLHAAASAAGGPVTGDVCLRLANGHYTVLTPDDRQTLLVNYA
ncbi:MAG TPA: argininosuccinate synthase domain-containing protein [Vicinamibacterales bacterium]|nr:argininosuccinate synthase domain-containing protein [Vicinamibacterales bacterium]